MVGHTHGPLDQRLSVISAAFQAATEIQEPQDWLIGWWILTLAVRMYWNYVLIWIKIVARILYLSIIPGILLIISKLVHGSGVNPCQDFVQIIRDRVTPARKRSLHAEVLDGSLNWKQYYDQYGVHLSGLVPNPHNKSEQEVCHCWRFIQREDSRLIQNLDYFWIGQSEWLIGHN